MFIFIQLSSAADDKLRALPQNANHVGFSFCCQVEFSICRSSEACFHHRVGKKCIIENSEMAPLSGTAVKSQLQCPSSWQATKYLFLIPLTLLQMKHAIYFWNCRDEKKIWCHHQQCMVIWPTVCCHTMKHTLCFNLLHLSSCGNCTINPIVIFSITERKHRKIHLFASTKSHYMLEKWKKKKNASGIELWIGFLYENLLLYKPKT